jgi:dethiobiotin synthetase
LKSSKNKISSVFVTATDTGAGKTVVTGLLARYISEQGHDVITQKWIQTGNGDFPEDIATHLKFMNLKKNDVETYLSLVCPYVFKYPSSPHLAAKLEKRKINVAVIKKSFSSLAKQKDCVVVEGLGGCLVPLNQKKLVIDIAYELNLPVLVVVGNKLGAINHAILTIEAIRSRGLKLLGLVFNDLSESRDIILKDNPKIIKVLTGEKILGHLPKQRNPELLYKAFVPIGKNILTELEGTS